MTTASSTLAQPIDQSEKRVFVLGAGFSATAGLPLSRTFFAEWMSFMRGVPDCDFQGLCNQIRFLARLYLAPTSGEYSLRSDAWHKDIDIERLLTIAEATTPDWRTIAAKGNRAARQLGDVSRDLIEDFKRSVSQYLFRDESTPSAAWDRIRSFAAQLRSEDVVITFNWDTLLEQTLAEQKKCFALRPGGRTAITLLKLHGSMDWLLDENDHRGRDKLTAPVIGRIRRATDYSAFMDRHWASFVPYLVPPSAYKRYAADLLRLWKAAHEAIYDATEVVIIGYSLPPTDWVSIALLRLPFRPEVVDARRRRPAAKRLWVVDPSPEVLARYRQQITADAKSGLGRASTWGWSVESPGTKPAPARRKPTSAGRPGRSAYGGVPRLPQKGGRE
jgi:hypothetical protein